jgi:PAS domain S-box-containing protein
MAEFESKTREELIEEIRHLRTQVITTRERNATISYDNMFQFVGLMDPQGNLLQVNPAALKISGVQLQDIIGVPAWDSPWWRNMSADTRMTLKHYVQVAYKEKRLVRYEVEIEAPGDNKLIYIDFSISPVFDDAGNIKCFITEGRDITERKHAEDEVRRKNEELNMLNQKIQELDKQKSIFLANVSHELKTPLALILGPAEKVLRQDSLITVEMRPVMESILANGNILLKHVNDLLDLSRLEARKALCEYTEVRDFSNYLKRLSSNFEVLAADRGITYDVIESLPFKVHCDVDKMEKIFLNLLSNAFKFTPNHGHIVVEMTHDEPATDKPRGLIRISVRDSGPGVPEKIRTKIFERFQQGDEGLSRKYGGTGLGLAIAKDFIELHQGTIDVRDSSLGGAEFIVEFPQYASSEVKITHDDRDSSLGMQTVLDVKSQLPIPERAVDNYESSLESTSPSDDSEVHVPTAEKDVVLVVEDNIAMNTFIKEALEDEFTVITAFNGKEGLRLAEKHLPDCILTDIMMPLMSGDQLVREVRKNPAMDKIPILLLTAKADDDVKVQLLRNGAQDYINKPFNCEDVKARISNMITIKKTWQTLTSTLSAQTKSLNELIDDIKILFNHDPACK